MDMRFRTPMVVLDETSTAALLGGQKIEISVPTTNMRAEDCKEKFVFPVGLSSEGMTACVRIVEVLRRAEVGSRAGKGRKPSHKMMVVHAPQ